MTNDKTLTMSREQFSVPREFLEVIANSSERSLSEINAAIQQARQILVAPVVEAAKCGICGQGAWACNEGGCHYLESGNGAPVVERQEPVAWLDDESGAIATDQLKALLIDDGAFGIPLYRSPPAPVAVVLPERKTVDVNDGALDNARKRGYNACIDDTRELNACFKVKEMNQCICDWDKRKYCGCFRPGICDKPKETPNDQS